MKSNIKVIAAGATTLAALLTSTNVSAQHSNSRDDQPYRQGYSQENRAEVLFSRGDRLPPRYRVEDMRGNNLRNPPRGQYWVRVNKKFLMVNARSGAVTEVVRVDNDRFADRGRGRDRDSADRDRDFDRDRGGDRDRGDRNDR